MMMFVMVWGVNWMDCIHGVGDRNMLSTLNPVVT